MIVSSILCLLVLLKAVGEISPCLKEGNNAGLLFAGFDIAMVLAIFYYSIATYKVAHGNALKYAFFLFAIYLLLGGSLKLTGRGWYFTGDMMLLSALIIAYVSRRLNKIEENEKLLLLVGALLLIEILYTIYVSSASLDKSLFAYILVSFNPLFNLTTISFAYIARYKVQLKTN